MGFAINPSLGFLDIPASYIQEFYRSKSEVVLPDARFRGHPCEAYICISKVDIKMRAYVAILETGSKNVLVYTSDSLAKSPAEYPDILKEAQDFVASFGFSMESVNIDFSPAMREVILKGFRVMRPPSQIKKKIIRPLKIDIPTNLDDSLATILSSGDDVQSEGSRQAVAELISVKTELASVRAALEQVTREKILCEQSAASQRTALQSACEQGLEAKRQAEERLSQIISLPEKETGYQRSSEAEEKIAGLRVQLDSAKEAGLSAEKEFARELARLRNEAEELRHEKESLKQKSSTDQAASAALLRGLQCEKEALEKRIAEEKAAGVAAAQRIAAMATSEQVNRKHEQILVGEISALTEKLSNTMEELETFKKHAIELEAIADKFLTLEREKEAVEAEYVRLATACMEKEARLSDRLAAAEMENERLSRERAIQEQVAAKEQTALRAELRRLLVEGGAQAPLAAESAVRMTAKDRKQADTCNETHIDHGIPQIAVQKPTTMPGDVPRKASHAVAPSLAPQKPLEEDKPDDGTDALMALDTDILKEFTSDFGNYYGGGGVSFTEFRLDPSLTCIPYAEPAEVIIVFYSSNMVQAVPDGSNSQKCRSYIAALKNDAGFSVYVAWQLIENNRIVVYLPEQQPVDRDSCVMVLKDAVAYFEIVGLMMEVADLGTTVKSYKKALEEIPALCRVT